MRTSGLVNGVSPRPCRCCGATQCDKPLSCRHPGHRCTRACHTGPCSSCQEPERQWCYCGAQCEVRTCGSGRDRPRSRNIKAGDVRTTASRALTALRLTCATCSSMKLQGHLGCCIVWFLHVHRGILVASRCPWRCPRAAQMGWHSFLCSRLCTCVLMTWTPCLHKQPPRSPSKRA
jgi:hypothetical protein